MKSPKPASKRLLWLVLAILITSGLISGLYLLTGTSKTSESTKKEVVQEENVDQTIKDAVISAAAPEIKDVVITDKKSYTDIQGTRWLRFHVTPLPEGTTDPAYGVMKQAGAEWQMVDFGTCCIEDNLPADVQQGLGFK